MPRSTGELCRRCYLVEQGPVPLVEARAWMTVASAGVMDVSSLVLEWIERAQLHAQSLPRMYKPSSSGIDLRLPPNAYAPLVSRRCGTSRVGIRDVRLVPQQSSEGRDDAEDNSLDEERRTHDVIGIEVRGREDRQLQKSRYALAIGPARRSEGVDRFEKGLVATRRRELNAHLRLRQCLNSTSCGASPPE